MNRKNWLCLALCLPSLIWGASATTSPTDSSPFSLPVLSIDSEQLNKADLNTLQRRLGIVVGENIDPRRVDEALRLLYQEGKIQSLFLEAEQERTGLRLRLRGGVVKKLRHLKLVDIDEDIYLEALKGLSPIEEGRNVESRMLAILRERMKSAYESRGYFFAEVVIRATEIPGTQEVDVEIIAIPGTPTRVRKLSVKGGNRRENEEIRSAVPLKHGDRFTRSLLDESIEVINRYFRANQYPNSKVDETNITFSEDKLSVDVDFALRIGERYQFQFSGNTVFEAPEFRAWLTPEVLGQSDAINNIVKLIETEYRRVGHHFVKVTPKAETQLQEKLTVVQFLIEEGSRVWIDAIRFNGGEYLGRGKMERLFYEGAPGVIARGVYWEEGLAEANSVLLRKVEALGFLRASIPSPRIVFSDDKKGAELVYDVELGEQTFVSRIEWSGVNSKKREDLQRLLPFSIGQPLNKQVLKEGKTEVLKYYSREGFNDAQFDLAPDFTVSDDQKSAVIKLSLHEGPQYFVGKVSIDGNRRTQTHVILREVKIKPGDKFDPELIRQSEDEIALLGLFARVEIISSVSPESATLKDLRVLVVEMKPGSGEVGLGAIYEDPRFRARGFLGLAYKNLFGLNQTASARTEVAVPISHRYTLIPFVEYSAVLGYRVPYPLGIPLSFFAQASLDSYETKVDMDGAISYLQTRAKIEERVEKKLSSHLTAIYRLHRFERTTTETLVLMESDDINNPNNPANPKFPGSKTPGRVRDDIGSTGPGIVLDFRDDIYNPTKGSYHTFDLEFAHPALFSQNHRGFYMGILRNSFYLPLVEPVGVAFFLGAGYANSIYADAPLPQARLLTDLSLGGQSSIRGYSQKTLSPDTSAVSAGYYNARMEFNSLLFDNVSGAIFFDTGKIYSRTVGQGWVTSESSHAVGVGFRYKTPVGPAVIDIAAPVNIDIAKGLPTGRGPVKFYFTIGIF